MMRAGEVIDKVSKVTARLTGQASGMYIQKKPLSRSQIDQWIRELEDVVLTLKRLRGDKV